MSQNVNITLIRHGKTPGNLRGSFVGSIDQSLAPEGVEELRTFQKAGRYPVDVQAVFTSPMRRCVETAQTLYGCDYSYLIDEPDTHIIDDLRERCFGDFEDKTHAEIIAVPGYEHWGRTEEQMPFPGGEELDVFLQRIGRAFWGHVDWMVAEGVHDTVIVTHGGVIMGFLSQYAQPAKGYFDWACQNGGGYALDCDAAARRIHVVSVL